MKYKTNIWVARNACKSNQFENRHQPSQISKSVKKTQRRSWWEVDKDSSDEKLDIKNLKQIGQDRKSVSPLSDRTSAKLELASERLQNRLTYQPNNKKSMPSETYSSLNSNLIKQNE